MKFYTVASIIISCTVEPKFVVTNADESLIDCIFYKHATPRIIHAECTIISLNY